MCYITYNETMNYEVKQTEEFAKWLDSIHDFVAKKLIYARVARLKFGNFGDVKQVGDGVSELRIHHGPGYRIYFVKDGMYIIILPLWRNQKSTGYRRTLGQTVV